MANSSTVNDLLMREKNMGKKSNKKKSRDGKSLDINHESRFDSSKPHFRLQREKASKVVLDDRFASVLTDPRFQVEVKDKYGRKKKRETKDDLKAFYSIEEEEEKKKGSPTDEDSSSSSDETGDESKGKGSEKRDELDEDPSSRIAYLTALSRGELDVSSSSEDDETDDEDDGTASEGEAEEEDPVMGSAGVLDPSNRQQEEIAMTDEPSPYLAVTNMDWNHVRAVDVFAIIASFTPPSAVKKVQVFVSDFGQERLKLEETIGPQGIWRQEKQKAKEQKASSSSTPYQDMSELSVGEGDDTWNPASALANDDDEDESDDEYGIGDEYLPEEDKVDKGFDPEKLRAYEASKLKYYFAVVELASPEFADIAYKEVDGMEFEHSSAAVDLRSIPVDELENVTTGRPLRDEACSLPSNYVPPEFIVSALQQTNVQCTWEEGDHERDRTLTKYGSAAWEAMAESDDLKNYIASDVSSDEEESKVQSKAAELRQMLGLDSEEGEKDDNGDSVSEAESGEDEATGEAEGKVAMFIPGQSQLKDKIKAKLADKDGVEELTPWQKYQEKRKLKRRERRQATREKRKEVNKIRSGDLDSDVENDFFISDKDRGAGEADFNNNLSQSKEELELLVAGEENEEDARDFDIRGIQRIEKNKDKKLRGSRKRKEDAFAENVAGTDFKVNVSDERFKAVLDGDDKFGIDPTDPNFKHTPGMKDIMAEQSRRRKSKRRKQNSSGRAEAVPDVSASKMNQTEGSAALSALVKSIKSRVN